MELIRLPNISGSTTDQLAQIRKFIFEIVNQLNNSYTEKSIVETKQITAIGKAVRDTIYETGEANGWSYRKWASGIAECWRTISVDNLTWAANGLLYEANLLNATDYPFVFASPPKETASATGITDRRTDNTEDKTSSYYALSTVSGGNTCKIHIYVIGRI